MRFLTTWIGLWIIVSCGACSPEPPVVGLCQIDHLGTVLDPSRLRDLCRDLPAELQPAIPLRGCSELRPCLGAPCFRAMGQEMGWDAVLHGTVEEIGGFVLIAWRQWSVRDGKPPIVVTRLAEPDPQQVRQALLSSLEEIMMANKMQGASALVASQKE